MNADVGAHRGATGVTQRLTRQFQTLDAERGGRCCVDDTRQLLGARSNGSSHVVELRPVDRLVQQGRAQGVQPAPAFVNQDARVHVLRVENLEEALGATFLADQSTVAFSEACCWQNQVRAVAGSRLLMVSNDHHLRSVQCSIDFVFGGAGVQIVFQHNDRVSLTVDDGLQRRVDRFATEHGQTKAVGFRHDQADRTVLLAQLQRLSDVGGGFDQGFGAQRSTSDDQRTFCREQGVGDALGQFQCFSVQTFNGRGAGVQSVSHGETDARQIVWSGVYAFFSDVVELGFRQAGDEQRVQRVLTDVLHRRVEPRLNAHGFGHVFSFAFDRLTQRQRHTGGGLGQVFTEHENRIVIFDVAHVRHWQRAVFEHLQDQADALQFGGFDTRIEVLGADQFAQRVVAFEAGARRTDTDDVAAAQQVGGFIQRFVEAQLGAARQLRLAWAVFAVDVAIAETATVAQEVLVHRTVETVFDATQFAVTLARGDVATAGAAMADARRELHVPFTVVALGVSLVGEHTGRADLGEVAGELAFQHAVFNATEVHVVVGAEHTEVGAAGVILVETHAAVASDAAVHFVRNERAQLLVLVGAFGEAIPALVVAGHHGHVLQVAVTAFFAHRAVVRVVGHQPFNNTGAERLGFFIVDGDPGVVGGRRHAGHDDATTGVVLVGVLLDRALAASANAAQGRVPAEIRNIEA
ncbi:hypothetical protein D3C73_343480 [compost metagenome]